MSRRRGGRKERPRSPRAPSPEAAQTAALAEERRRHDRREEVLLQGGLIGLSALLFLVRIYAGHVIGFGDSEALYASWALHPQPAYLDHPALVAIAMRLIGQGGVPAPDVVHALTTIAVTLMPWLVSIVARTAGAKRREALGLAIVFALVPEIAIGLYALTPDLLLCPLWLGAIALALVGLRARRPEAGAGAFVGAGLLAGVAATAKVPAFLLVAALAVAYGSLARSGPEGARRAARTAWPWAGLLVGLIAPLPFVLYEVAEGWPMLRHRLVDTQVGLGPSLANLGKVVGGQLAYVSPAVVLLLIFAARDLVRERNADATSRVLFWAFALPFGPLLVFCLLSPVAEPHWLAPPLLALALHGARRAAVLFEGRARLVRLAAGTAGLMTALAHAWVLVPQSARLLPRSVDPKVDIASELFGWPTAVAAIREELASAVLGEVDPKDTVLVGPHWTVCGQLAAGIPDYRVGCATPVRDDFDGWLPRKDWRRASSVVYVTDNRFPSDGAFELPDHAVASQRTVRIMRGGRTARVFSIYRYAKRAQALRD